VKKIFKRQIQTHTNKQPSTPYQKASQEWDNRMGSLVVQIKNWQFTAILSLLIAVLLLIMLIASFWMTQNHVFVAQVSDTGQVINVSPLKVTYHPTQAQKEYFLGYFIKLIREVPLDPVLAKQNWLSAYHFLTERSSEELNRYLRANNPLNLLGKNTITVKIKDIHPVNANSFEVDWMETIVDRHGQVIGQKLYNGMFTLMIKQPKTQKMIMNNPLGIYILDFNISTRSHIS